jgi:hypothetical protein
MKRENNVVSIIGDAYCQPIADLIAQLVQRSRPVANRFSAGYYEFGYSAATVLLLVAMFESYISRLRYLAGARVPATKRHAPDVFATVCPRFRLMKALVEVYVLRDLLIHNHLWEVDMDSGGKAGLIWKTGSKHAAYGDKKHHERVNLVTNRTKAIKLHVVPTRVDRTDVSKCFKVIWRALSRMHDEFPDRAVRPTLTIKFQGKRVYFHELQSKLETACAITTSTA